MRDRVGQQLGGYRLVRFLGQGGFAEVYLGEHVHFHTQAAIKVLQARLTSEDIEKFHQEVHLIGLLKHPHIVQVLDSSIQDGLPFLVMSYAPNGTLRQRHREGSRLPLATIMIYLKQVASALQYAHDHRVIHRDVKPQNMLIRLNDETLLSDFGLAIVSQSTSSQHMQNRAGTVLYMAPEQLEGKARPASDQYALGVVVYEWLCGERPFHGLPLEIAVQHQFAPPPPLRQKVPAISTALEQVVLKALAKDPKERWTSVQEFAVAFEQASRTVGQSDALTRASQASSLALPKMPLDPLLNVDLSPRSPKLALSHPQMLQFPFPPGADGTSTLSTPRSNRKGLSRMQTAMLIGLLLMVILGSTGVLYLTKIKQAASTRPPLTTAQIRATIAARAYAAGTSNGVMFGFDAQHTHFNPYENVLNPANVFRLVPYWSASVGSTVLSSYSSPTVVNGIVYIGSEDHKLYAFDASTGKPRWAAPTAGAIDSSPAVADNVVYIGSEDHKLYAFDASTGKPRWAAPTAGAIKSSPTVVNGIVYIGSEDHKLYAFDASTGKLRWAAPTAGAIDSSPAAANNVVYIGSDDDKFYAFNASSGSILWSATTSGTIDSSPAVVHNIVYVGSRDSKFYAFNASTGALLWFALTGGPIGSSPAIANGIVYIASGNGFGVQHGWLYAFDASTGKPRWVASVNRYIYSSPTIANGVIYVGPNNGDLHAFDAQTGRDLWTANAGTPLFSSPAVFNGVVYVGSSGDERLYAFHLFSAAS